MFDSTSLVQNDQALRGERACVFSGQDQTAEQGERDFGGTVQWGEMTVRHARRVSRSLAPLAGCPLTSSTRRRIPSSSSPRTRGYFSFGLISMSRTHIGTASGCSSQLPLSSTL